MKKLTSSAQFASISAVQPVFRTSNNGKYRNSSARRPVTLIDFSINTDFSAKRFLRSDLGFDAFKIEACAESHGCHRTGYIACNTPFKASMMNCSCSSALLKGDSDNKTGPLNIGNFCKVKGSCFKANGSTLVACTMTK